MTQGVEPDEPDDKSDEKQGCNQEYDFALGGCQVENGFQMVA